MSWYSTHRDSQHSKAIFLERAVLRPCCGYCCCMSRILKWNGNDVPEELRSLPAGRYVVEALDETMGDRTWPSPTSSPTPSRCFWGLRMGPSSRAALLRSEHSFCIGTEPPSHRLNRRSAAQHGFRVTCPSSTRKCYLEVTPAAQGTSRPAGRFPLAGHAVDPGRGYAV